MLKKRTMRMPCVAGALLLAVALKAPSAVAAEDLFKPGDNLAISGLPAITNALVERVRPYNESRSATFLDWNPTKREMLIATRFGDVRQVHRVAFPLGARTQLTFYPEQVVSAGYRPKTGEGIVFSKDIGGNEFFQLYYRDNATGQATLLTDGKSRNTGARFSHSGRVFAYTSTRRTGKDNDVYLMNPTDPKTDRLVLEVSGGGWGVTDIADDEKTLLLGEYVSANESRYYLLDVANGTKTLLTPETKEKVSYGTARYSRDGKAVYVTTDKDVEFARIVRIDLATKKWQEVTPGLKWDVNSFDLSDDGRWLVYVLNEGGAETLHLLDLKTGKEVPLPKLPLGTIGAYGFHENSKDLAVTLASARSTSDVYSIDVTTGKLERWTESETGGLDASSFVEPEPISWKSFDGLTITGFLYRPPARFSGPRPVILNIHGGPEAQSQPGFLGRSNYLLNELGVAIIFPNVRGSSGFGKTFLKLDNAEKREDSVKDIGALLDYIATRKDLDASRVMVTGGSYGGYMTLASMVHFGDRLKCGLEVVGISSFVTFLERTEGYRRDLRRVEYGDERDPKMREFLTSISPLTNASRIRKPLFVVQGKNDPRVPYTEAEQIVEAVKKSGTEVWSLMASDEGHGFAKKNNNDFLFLAMVRFVEENLLK